jgi:hypothetical protein
MSGETSNIGQSGFSTGGLSIVENLSAGIGKDIIKSNAVSSGILMGGGLKGYMPQPLIDQDRSYIFPQTRFALREAWNTTPYSGQDGLVVKRIITPFRAVYNIGDPLSRENYSCGGGCQTFQSRPGVFGLRGRFGATQNVCDQSTVPPSTCNVKYVSDASLYIRFKKEQAFNRNYNARKFGGNNYSGAQVAQRAIHRY